MAPVRPHVLSELLAASAGCGIAVPRQLVQRQPSALAASLCIPPKKSCPRLRCSHALQCGPVPRTSYFQRAPRGVLPVFDVSNGPVVARDTSCAGRTSQGIPQKRRLVAAQPGSATSFQTVDERRVWFCSKCGAATERRVPDGDDKLRDVCSSAECGNVHYENPKIVVGAVCVWEDQVLLCKRAIEPCRGLWGFPQGYMELGESTREGAVREALEEAGVGIRIRSLLAVYNIPNQVQVIYIADMVSPQMSCGFESAEVGLFRPSAIPFDQLAFPTVRWALQYALSVGLGSRDFQPQQRTKLIKFDDNGAPIYGLYVDE